MNLGGIKINYFAQICYMLEAKFGGNPLNSDNKNIDHSYFQHSNRKLISTLILPNPGIPESCFNIKIDLNFYFHTSLWCLKRFYEEL